MPVEEVVGRLLEAMAMTEVLEDRPIADDYFVYAPLAQQTLAGLPSIEPPEPTPANDEVQEAMIRDFLNADGVAAAIGFEGDPGFAHDVGEFCELFIHYSERFAGGDRYRWSPMVVEGSCSALATWRQRTSRPTSSSTRCSASGSSSVIATRGGPRR
ncbi:MAG: hypothetical protein IPG03_06995 [Candidatus Microthrix sp.]|nr:hypothetical protein [Candidatus Microthrix sp.]MBK6502110.1 hypothetical protein [Candidatus Microthrix sp.]